VKDGVNSESLADKLACTTDCCVLLYFCQLLIIIITSAIVKRLLRIDCEVRPQTDPREIRPREEVGIYVTFYLFFFLTIYTNRRLFPPTSCTQHLL
jgi:hypothetical protein